MNIVEMLTQQLSGDLGKKLGGMAGLNEAELTKVLGVGLPGLLSGLGSLASSEQGAGKIADAIRGMDSSVLGNLSDLLKGDAAQKGGGLLGNLLGSGLVDGLAGAISKATGVNQSMIKTILGYLAPIILGAIASSFQGGKVDASSVSRLFADQKNNIAAALPSGMNLGSIQGLQSLASASMSIPATGHSHSAAEGFGRLVLPLIILGIIGIGAFFYFRQSNTPTNNASSNNASSGATESPLSSLQGAAAEATEKTKGLLDSAKDKIENALPDANLMSVKDKLDELIGNVATELGKITDSTTAEETLPKLKNSILKLESFSATMGMVPAEGKAVINGFVKSQLEKLNPIIEQISAIPGLGDSVKQVIEH